MYRMYVYIYIYIYIQIYAILEVIQRPSYVVLLPGRMVPQGQRYRIAGPRIYMDMHRCVCVPTCIHAFSFKTDFTHGSPHSFRDEWFNNFGSC